MKLVCFLWVFLLFKCVDCFDVRIFSEAVCELNCLEPKSRNYQIANKSECQDDCMKNKINFTMNADILLEKPYLHCRGETELAFKWNYSSSGHPTVFIVDSKFIKGKWIKVKVSDNFFILDGLMAASEYTIRVWAVDATGAVAGPKESNRTRTLSRYTEPPNHVTEFGLDAMKLIDEGFYAKVKWTPNADLSCFYDIIWFVDNGVADYSQIEIKKPLKDFHAFIGKLDFESNYSVALMAKNEAWDLESNKTWIKLHTPACLDIYTNLSICPPLMPTNVTMSEVSKDMVTADGKSVTLYDITVRWDPPDLCPDTYIVVLTSLLGNNANGTKITATVDGTETSALLESVYLGLQYQVSVRAVSRAGSSDQALEQRQLLPASLRDNRKRTLVISAVFVASAGAVVLLIILTLLYYRSARQKRYEKRCKYFEELEEKAQMSLECIMNDDLMKNYVREADKWEIKSDQIILQSVIGEGAFGLVRKGWLSEVTGKEMTKVAVKMLKDAPTGEHIRHFLHEIEIMKSVGPHPHLVSILGCCTRPEPGRALMLVVEFCELGDLQNYLQKIWLQVSSKPTAPAQITYSELVFSPTCPRTPNIIVNQLYELDSGLQDTARTQSSDLLSFARQICIGMEFLSNMKIIHRDLAARNVLVCADKSVKIADFGLSRDVYEDNIYRKTGNGKLPVRWMAIESLTHQVYTSQSDVWSFGILLWEIVTLGGNPYPSISATSLLKLLRSGYRMEKPLNCSSELYYIMFSCWKYRPKDRPTFMELRKSLDKLLEDSTNAKYLDLDVLTCSEFMTIRSAKLDDSFSHLQNQTIDTIIGERYVHSLPLSNQHGKY